MREIKFRVWDIKNKEFNLNSIKHQSIFVLTLEGEVFVAELGGISKFDEQNNYIIQQFTGLKDKNGKDIYEGDFLKLSEKDRSEYYSEYCNVWYSNSGHYVVSFNHLYSETSCELFMVNYTYEIVGNIFETPELLK